MFLKRSNKYGNSIEIYLLSSSNYFLCIILVRVDLGTNSRFYTFKDDNIDFLFMCQLIFPTVKKYFISYEKNHNAIVIICIFLKLKKCKNLELTLVEWTQL